MNASAPPDAGDAMHEASDVRPCSDRDGRLTELATAALFGVVVMTSLQSATPWLADNDSYYHAKMARLLPELGFIHEFPWLHWTIFRERFVSHHHGFHVFLAPFVAVSESLTGGLILGAKTANVIAASMTCLAFCAVLRRLNVAQTPVWLLTLACAPLHFWLRLAYIRAPMIALPLMLLALWLILAGRPVWLAAVTFMLTHVYNGAVLLLVMPAALLLATLVRRDPLRPALMHGAAIVIGIAAGLVLHPYFPDNLDFLRTQLFGSGLGAPIEAGVEWRRYDGSFFLAMSAPLIAIWTACLIYRLRRGTRLSTHSIFLLLLNLLFLVLTLKARRFIEYWPVFALINAADLVTIPPTSAYRTIYMTGGQSRSWPVMLAVGLLVISGLINLRTTRASIGPSYDPGQLRGPMEYLRSQTPANSIVFTDDWDLFPYCFYWNHQDRYVVGLDPVFTMEKYPEVWQRYRLITRGQTPATLPARAADDPGSLVTLGDIHGVFEADFVLVASDHPALYEQLRGDPAMFRLIYPPEPNDGDASPAPFSIFKVISAESGGR